MAEKLTFEDAARRLGWLALFAALFVLAGTPLLSWIGAAPLVLAAVLALCIRTLHAATKGQDPDFPATSVIAILAISVGLALIFLVANDPLWVKRTVSVLAALQLLVALLPLRSSDPEFDLRKLRQGQRFQAALAVSALILNEAAIYLGEDWLWIASRAALILLTPIIVVAVAKSLRLA